MSKAITSAVEKLVRPTLDDNGFELVQIEYVKEGSNRFLRIVIDKPGGIDIEDCSRVSELASSKLDESDPIPDSYFLEVTSPGAERPLKKSEDFLNAIGKNVFVSIYEPLNGRKEFEGLLESYDDDQLVVREGKAKFAIPTAKVASARLAVVF